MSARKAAPAPEPEPEEDGQKGFTPEFVAEIVERVTRNPYTYLTMLETRALFGFGRNAMRNLLTFHPPMVVGKFNAEHFRRWLWNKREVLENVKG